MSKASLIVKSLQTSFENESIVRRILSEQSESGIQFNLRRANRYVSYIERKKSQLYDRIRPLLQLEVIQHGNVPVNKPFKKDGTYSAAASGWYGDDVGIVWGVFTRVRFEEPNLGSRQKLQSQLLRLGWKPRYFTEKGNPKLTHEGQPCESLNKIDSQVGKDIAEWYILNHRLSQINGWISALRLDGRLSQEVITIGTPTYRMRHKVVVNVPKAASHVVFGKQMRSLFTVPRGKVLVGHDASGLELRMLAHYMNDKDYTEAVVHGKQENGTDLHSVNQRMAGLPTRDDAKTFIYAFNYGAGDAKIGSIIGKGAREGKAIKYKFLQSNPALASLIDRVTRASQRGYLVGLDGRRLRMRRDKRTGQVQTNKALNTLLQGAGSVVMKHSIVLLDKYIKEEGLSSIKVIDMHDEAQFECLPHEAERHGELAVKSIVQAGIDLGLNCPLDAEYKIGKNWAETH